MRTLLLLITIVGISIKCYSQDVTAYKDLQNGFAINIPKNWQIQQFDTANSTIKLMVKRMGENPTDTSRETYNVNVLLIENSNLESAYQSMTQSISGRPGFTLIKEGTEIIANQKYKWLVEIHKNKFTSEQMKAYILLGYNNGKAYMITFSTIDRFFDKFENEFKTISSSLQL